MITKEELEKHKKDIADAIPILRSDYYKLGSMINLFEDYVRHGTLENCEEYQKMYDNIDDSFQIIEVWTT